MKIRFLTVLPLILILALSACQLPIGQTPPTAVVADTPAQVITAGDPTATAQPVEPTATLAEFTPTAEPAATATETAPPATAVPPTPLPAPANLATLVDAQFNLSLWEEGKGLRQLDSSGDIRGAVPSPDGRQVAYVRSKEGESASLWVVNSDGSQPRELVTSAQMTALASDPNAYGNEPYHYVWVPGQADTLAFNTRLLFNGPGLLVNDDLVLVNTQTGTHTQLLAPGTGGMFYYAPYGSLLAISRTTGVDLRKADGSLVKENAITFSTVLTYSEYAFYPEPVWAPDSSRLMLSIPPADSLTNTSEPTAIWRMDKTGQAEQIGSVVTQPLRHPYISPQLTHLAYVTDPNPGTNQFELVLSNEKGENPAVYEPGFGMWFGWLPDGQKFTYLLLSSDEARLGRLDMPPAPLSDVNGVVDVKCFPDGKCLFLRFLNPGWELREVLPGSASTLIHTFPGDFGAPLLRLP